MILLASAKKAAPPPRPQPRAAEPSAVEARLAAVAPDEMTPRQALDLVYELASMLRRGETGS